MWTDERYPPGDIRRHSIAIEEHPDYDRCWLTEPPWLHSVQAELRCPEADTIWGYPSNWSSDEIRHFQLLIRLAGERYGT